MPSIDDIYSGKSNYLKHADLNGKPVALVIADVTIEELEDKETGQKKQQLVLHFVNTEKRLGLNKTNAKAIATVTSEADYTKWTGWKIRLKPARTAFGNKEVDCIRVSDEFGEPPVASAAPVKPLNDDDIPF